jgi:hypothetical protein
MRIRFTAILVLYVIKVISAQTLQIEREYNARHYEFNDIEINLTPGNYNIINNNIEIYSESIHGKKIFKSSSEQNYFFIANYQFTDSKNDYPVEVNVFNREGSLVFNRKFLAPYDLPHPLLSINDQGVLTLFDPLSFKVRLIDRTSDNELELEKEVPFEMERAAFVEMNDDFLFILASQSALDITENKNNVNLYKVSLVDLKIDKKELDYNTPTLLKITGNSLFISGVKFEESKQVGRTMKYDFELNIQAANHKIIEKMSANGGKLYAKYLNVIYDLNADLTVSNEKKLPGNERILDLKISDGKLIVVGTNELTGSHLYSILPDLRVDFNAALDNFGVSKIEDFSISQNHIMIRHDSKSTKLKTNRN